MASMRSRYSAVRYRLRIDLSTGSEPLWSGMWKWGWNLLLSATWAMISGVKRLGSMLLMRNRSAGTSLSRAWTKSKTIRRSICRITDVHPGQYNLLGSLIRSLPGCGHGFLDRGIAGAASCQWNGAE